MGQAERQTAKEDDNDEGSPALRAGLSAAENGLLYEFTQTDSVGSRINNFHHHFYDSIPSPGD